MGKCPHDPRELKGEPIGMYHCPVCGEMVIAGLPHEPKRRTAMDREKVEAIIAEVRLLDGAVEWRAACDEIMDRVRDRESNIGKIESLPNGPCKRCSGKEVRGPQLID
jgi:hypothetical protein